MITTKPLILPIAIVQMLRGERGYTKRRVAALAELICVAKIPYDLMDPLSQGLTDYANELKALDE